MIRVVAMSKVAKPFPINKDHARIMLSIVEVIQRGIALKRLEIPMPSMNA